MALTSFDAKVAEALVIVLHQPLLMSSAQLDGKPTAEDGRDIRERLAKHREPKVDEGAPAGVLLAEEDVFKMSVAMAEREGVAEELVDDREPPAACNGAHRLDEESVLLTKLRRASVGCLGGEAMRQRLEPILEAEDKRGMRDRLWQHGQRAAGAIGMDERRRELVLVVHAPPARVEERQRLHRQHHVLHRVATIHALE